MKRYKMFKLKTFSSERIKVKTMLNFVAGLSSDKTVLIFFCRSFLCPATNSQRM